MHTIRWFVELVPNIHFQQHVDFYHMGCLIRTKAYNMARWHKILLTIAWHFRKQQSNQYSTFSFFLSTKNLIITIPLKYLSQNRVGKFIYLCGFIKINPMWYYFTCQKLKLLVGVEMPQYHPCFHLDQENWAIYDEMEGYCAAIQHNSSPSCLWTVLTVGAEQPFSLV